ncbi:thiamine-phosphate kinase [candidate division WOR-1 bacterium RIFOXYB2_FULL_37_13]|uniref:Thiamine-monophosphate kinase n=1 Tax=candidate division WOR-1 bacterium RIFOXYB2_FULL_37_13 TaxID=1802579 RepID=A0A1F4SUW2_UNCSA|nr:MAG: thiamine-phosphate kinase [candidate division WOR-1 bacterium RIFOXYB2_FULL_37_13]
MNLSALGEFGLIELLKKLSPNNKRVVFGIGDDAAVLSMTNENKKTEKLKNGETEKLKNEKYLLITTDAFVERVHFIIPKKVIRNYFFNLGSKILAANISDIAAMGGYPTFALLTLCAPQRTKIEDIKELYRGISRLAEKYDIEIIGGDTTASKKDMMISVTLLGEVEKENILLRSGAKDGDLICVTGKFGEPASTNFQFPISNVQLPIRLLDARKLAKARFCSSMIDASDGLIRSVTEICKASKTGAKILTDDIPIAKGATLAHALYGGEEYELVFTISKSKFSKLPTLKAKISIVGEITKKSSGVTLSDSHGRINRPREGFEHF